MIEKLKTIAAATLLAGLVAIPAGAADGDDGWITLFDGTNLSAWDDGSGGAPRDGWVIEDGAVTRKKPAGYLWSKQRFGDFLLEVEFKAEGNSGVFFRTGNPRDCVQTGFEMQVDRPRGRTSKHSVGAFYDAMAPSENAAIDGWNKAVITCVGSKVTIDLNDKRIIDADLDQWDQARQNPDGTPNKYRTALKDFPREGHIGLQEHGAVVSYRNIRVKPLAETAQREQQADASLPDPTGTWKWERTFGDNTMQFVLRLKADGKRVTGTYKGPGDEVEIEEGQLAGDKLSFRVSREYNDRKFTIKYEGKVGEDTIEGTGAMSSDRGSREFDWEAKRSVELADVLGMWRFKIEAPDGNVVETSIDVKKDGDEVKGAYTDPWAEREAKNIKFEKNELTFEISGENEGTTFKVIYKGKPNGDVIEGTIEYDFGGQTGTMDFDGKRVRK